MLVGIRFQVSFTPLVGVLFTFPSRYWCTIGRQGVLRLGGWSPHLQAGFHVSRPTRGQQGFLPVRGCHPLWPDFPDGSGSYLAATGLVRVRSPLLAESRLMSFPPGTEMFQFPGFASATYGFSDGYSLRSGLPHSEIPGSKPARGSPRLFAACHVLHRLLAPRHPPDALAFLGPHQRQPQPGPRAKPAQEPDAAAATGNDSSVNCKLQSADRLFAEANRRQAYPCQTCALPQTERRRQARMTCRRPPYHDACKNRFLHARTRRGRREGAVAGGFQRLLPQRAVLARNGPHTHARCAPCPRDGKTKKRGRTRDLPMPVTHDA